MRRSAAGAVTASLLLSLFSTVPAQAGPGGTSEGADTPPGGIVDRVDLGDTASESAHEFRGESTQAVTGAKDRPARQSLPTEAQSDRLGDQNFTVDVDPVNQNHVSLVYWGEDASADSTVLLVDGEYVTYGKVGDYQASNFGTQGGLPGRFFATTTLLPLSTTQGRDEVRITVRTKRPDESTSPSRGYYEAVVHTEASLPDDVVDPDAEVPAAGPAPQLSPEEQQAKIDSYREKQLTRFAELSQKVDSSSTARMDIAKYQNELRWYAESLTQSWSPASTAAEKRDALDRIFATIDRYTTDYYGDVRSLGTGGHQSDWGGYYAELGEALYIVENLIADDDVLGQEAFEQFLDEHFETGTTDGPNSIAGVDWQDGELSRGEAWERVLKANFDFARSRLSYISNQVHYTYEGAWRAHEGLRVIGSDFYEGKDRSHRILREIWGVEPFLGEEVLVGPDGEDLDLYHSLFNHDRTAEYTDDYLQVVMRGLAQSELDDDGEIVRRAPYGEHHFSLTGDKALFRENRYVGAYGETGSWIPTYFWRTWGHAGDEELNAELLRQALRNLHARGQTRYQGMTEDGHRVMVMDQVVDDRNLAYPGKTAYGTEVGQNLGLLYASLEQHMAENAEMYSGEEWDEYWEYAREATGFVQQQMVDGQYFPHFSSTIGTQSFNKDLRVPESWEWITQGRAEDPRFESNAAGVVLPDTNLGLYSDDELDRLGVARDDLDEPTAWVDVDNLFVTFRDGETSVTGSLAMQNYGWAGNGRLHVRQPGWSQNVQVRTEGTFEYRTVDVRPSSMNEPIVVDQDAGATAPPFAQGAELIPITYQPGVGEVQRDNYMADTPYSAYPDVISTSYGSWFVAMNTTREEYGNSATHDVAVPAGTPDEVEDLVSGRTVRVTGPEDERTVRLEPGRSVVLRIDDADAVAQAPERVDVAVASAGATSVALSWNPSAGAQAYDVWRAKGKGKPTRVAHGLADTSWIDDKAGRSEHEYTVVAVGPDGDEARPSNPVASAAHGERVGRDWQKASIGETDRVKVRFAQGDARIEVDAADGFAGGDDFKLEERLRPDSLGQVSRLTNGATSVSGKVVDPEGSFSGVVMRDSLDDVARYVALGADEDGDLELRVRELDSRVNLSGNPGQDGEQGQVVSPRVHELDATLADTPYVRLDRDVRTQRVVAYVSADGQDWERVVEKSFVSTDTLHVGAVTAGSVHVEDLRVSPLDPTRLRLDVERADGEIGLRWSRPQGAAEFTVYRTEDPQVAKTDPVDGGWETVEESTLDSGVDLPEPSTASSYGVVARDASGAVHSSASVELAGS